jgi:hypothetical protein
MNKIVVLFIVFCILSFGSNTCFLPLSLPVAKADTTDINPNGSSELSLLMREMYNHLAEARKGLEIKKQVSYPKSFLTLTTAQATDEHTKNEYYNTFADLYLQSLENYSKSTNENRAKNYNSMVNACLACHSSHCPGPVPKIKKLLLPVAP